MPKYRILIVDDERSVRFGIRNFLTGRDYEVDEAETMAQAEGIFSATKPDLAILDYSLPDGTALDLLPKLKALHETTPLIVLTAHSSVDLALKTLQEGAEQFLTKPVQLPTLLVVIERLLDNQRLRQKEQAETKRQTRRAEPDPFIGESDAIRRLREQVEKIVSAERPVLILGETGTGKSVLAGWLHRHGPRANEAFVDLNCAGLSKEFVETELFGHEKGAFTGAVAAKQGLLEVAHRGVLFLDEIGDVDVQVQPKLLKVLEEKRFRRMGEVRDRMVDVQLIAATHQDLTHAIRDKRFRSDLYFRISTIPLTIPPLRERIDDVPAIARHLLENFSLEMGYPRVELGDTAIRAMTQYGWPGNIRELKNVLERALLLSDRQTLLAKDLRFEEATPSSGSADLSHMTLEEVERHHIETILRLERGHVERASKRLGVPRSSLYQKIRRFGIQVTKD